MQFSSGRPVLRSRIHVIRSLLAFTILAVSLAGCTSPRQWLANGCKVGPNYCKPAAKIAPDWIDSDDRRVLQGPVDHAAWWATLNDPVLNQLVAEAYRQNLDLREAGARIMQARALRCLAVGNMFPQRQDLSSSYSHNLATAGRPDRHFSVWNGQFNLAWEVDFWGRFRRAVEAADADLDASIFDYGDIVVTLVADVAATYVDIRTLQTRLELVKRNVENQRKTYELTKTRLQVGESSDVDVQQAKSSLAQTEGFVPQLEVLLRQSQNQLCVLLGLPPEDLTERLRAGKVPTVADSITVGIPADLLLRRPDVRRAERLLAGQSARIGVAESDLYPIISLSGSVGRTGSQFDELFQGGSSNGSVGPSLRWNILNYGRIKANIDVQDARFCELLHSYRQTVLLANLEAENAIIDFLKSQERLEWQLEAAEAAAKTNDLVNQLFAEGDAAADFNRVFNVQNFKTQQEESAAVAKGAVAQNYIAIYRALGGGWPSPFLRDAIIELPPTEGETVAPAEDSEEVEAPRAEELPALDLAVPVPLAPVEAE